MNGKLASNQKLLLTRGKKATMTKRNDYDIKTTVNWSFGSNTLH